MLSKLANVQDSVLGLLEVLQPLHEGEKTVYVPMSGADFIKRWKQDSDDVVQFMAFVADAGAARSANDDDDKRQTRKRKRRIQQDDEEEPETKKPKRPRSTPEKQKEIEWSWLGEPFDLEQKGDVFVQEAKGSDGPFYPGVEYDGHVYKTGDILEVHLDGYKNAAYVMPVAFFQQAPENEDQEVAAHDVRFLFCWLWSHSDLETQAGIDGAVLDEKNIEENDYVLAPLHAGNYPVSLIKAKSSMVLEDLHCAFDFEEQEFDAIDYAKQRAFFGLVSSSSSALHAAQPVGYNQEKAWLEFLVMDEALLPYSAVKKHADPFVKAVMMKDEKHFNLLDAVLYGCSPAKKRCWWCKKTRVCSTCVTLTEDGGEDVFIGSDCAQKAHLLQNYQRLCRDARARLRELAGHQDSADLSQIVAKDPMLAAGPAKLEKLFVSMLASS
jgi:hypothetical protein